MCGICGFYSKQKESLQNLIQMNNTMVHRGPDDHGEIVIGCRQNKYCIGMAHRRLSIHDLSQQGHQPMQSNDGRVMVVFNGEIYNYADLRLEIDGYSFRSNCDTEVILAAYMKWGIEFVDHIQGMFAIALFDKKDESLYLIRDRMGKKPLYYYLNAGNLYYASELKPLMTNPNFQGKINEKIVGKFLYRQYINAPNTIFQNTYKLKPGEILKFQYGKAQQWTYWDVAEIYNRKFTSCSYEEAKEKLEKLLRDAVIERMAADVPVGEFLSGGYDSALICAIAQSVSNTPIKTYSIGFDDENLDEAPFAKQIAQYLGTNHTEHYISEKEMLDLVKSIPLFYDEPFADPSQICTMLVSKLARKDVTVVLTGDGGDELFGGYTIYKKLASAQGKKVQGAVLHFLLKIPFISNKVEFRKIPFVYRVAAESLDPRIKTQTGSSHYLGDLDRILICKEQESYLDYVERRYKENNWAYRRMLLDLDTYLPGDILCKVDRASMKYSLEARCPFLDKSIVEFSLGLPLEYKIVDGKLKRILKDITYKYIPKELMDRPKQGFYVPIERWLRNELKEELLAYTDSVFLKKQGIFHERETQEFVHAFLRNGNGGENTGKNYGKFVWSYFIFQQWYQCYENLDEVGVSQMRYDELREKITGGGYKCLFCAGLIGRTWGYDTLKAMGCRIDFYCDNNIEEGRVVRDGVRTISLEKLYSFKNNVQVFITAAYKYQNVIKQQLEANGIYNIIAIDYSFMQSFVEDLLKKNDHALLEKFRFIVDDEEYIRRQFRYRLGYELDLKNPRTFNEKIQWLKLYDRKNEYIRMVDKYEVKKYIADKTNKKYAIPTLGIYNSFDEIDFGKLPRKFVLKCTHDSGSIVICREKTKLDLNNARIILENGLRRNFYWSGREWPYKNVKPRIIAEPLIGGDNQENFIDYKFLCANGKVEISFTCSNRFRKEGLCVNFYDREWKPMPFERHYPRRSIEIEKPEKYEEMIEIAEKLSYNIKFVRIDFYFIQGKVYVGEMTFYPGNGMEEFKPEEWDYRLGEMIRI